MQSNQQQNLNIQHIFAETNYLRYVMLHYPAGYIGCIIVNVIGIPYLNGMVIEVSSD